MVLAVSEYVNKLEVKCIWRTEHCCGTGV